jgi:flagellar basal body-associated protein FliL
LSDRVQATRIRRAILLPLLLLATVAALASLLVSIWFSREVAAAFASSPVTGYNCSCNFEPD